MSANRSIPNSAGAPPLPKSQKNAILRALKRSVDPADKGDLAPEMAAAFRLSDLGERLEAIARALGKGRVILPVLPHGKAADATCPTGQLPQVELAGINRARAVIAYSSLATFSSATAAGLGEKLVGEGTSNGVPRPLPVGGRALAVAALDSPGRILLDGRYLLPRPALNALVCADQWVPAWKNREFLAQVERLINQVLPQAPWKIIPPEGTVERLLIAVNPARPCLAEDLNDLQKKINSLESLEAAADLLALTPIPLR